MHSETRGRKEQEVCGCGSNVAERHVEPEGQKFIRSIEKNSKICMIMENYGAEERFPWIAGKTWNFPL